MLGFLLAASGGLRCAAPANCSEDRVAQAIWRRWGRDSDSQNQRNEATGHTAHDTHTDAHTSLTHTSTRDSTSGEKTPLHSGPHDKGTTKQRTGARARSAP